MTYFNSTSVLIAISVCVQNNHTITLLKEQEREWEGPKYAEVSSSQHSEMGGVNIQRGGAKIHRGEGQHTKQKYRGGVVTTEREREGERERSTYCLCSGYVRQLCPTV